MPDSPPPPGRGMSRAQARHPEVAVRCRHCKAQAGRDCTNQRSTTPMSEPHRGRRDDWTVATVDCTECGAPCEAPCIPANPLLPMPGPHQARVQAADVVYAKAIEDASRDMPGGKR